MKILNAIALTAVLTAIGVAHAEGGSEVAPGDQVDSADLSAQLSWSVVRTELKKAASAYVVRLEPRLPADKILGGVEWGFYLRPSLDVKTGGDDALDSATIKAEGFYWPFLRTGLKCNWLHLFPYSVGVEANSQLDEYAAIAEVGWLPLGPCNEDKDRFGFTANRRIGVFLQGGYLFDESNPGDQTKTGGKSVGSDEEGDHGVARVKADASYGFAGSWGSFTPRWTGWYDVVDTAVYYHVEASLKIALVKDKYFIDFKYEKGSGAPSFNKGDQYGVGLAVMF